MEISPSAFLARKANKLPCALEHKKARSIEYQGAKKRSNDTCVVCSLTNDHKRLPKEDDDDDDDEKEEDEDDREIEQSRQCVRYVRVTRID